MKICIPSKGRPDRVLTKELFDKNDVILFVEPQELDDYVKENPDVNVVDIGKNDQGVSFVRNTIKKYMGDSNYLMLDDDILRTHEWSEEADKFVKCEPHKVLEEIERYIDDNVFVIVPKRTFAKFFNRGHVKNKNVARCFLAINGSKASEYEYDSYVDGLEDLDITLQVLKKKKHDFVVITDYSHDSKFVSTGGCENLRNKVSNDECSFRMIDKWGEDNLKPVYSKKTGKLSYLKVNYKNI